MQDDRKGDVWDEVDDSDDHGPEAGEVDPSADVADGLHDEVDDSDDHGPKPGEVDPSGSVRDDEHE